MKVMEVILSKNSLAILLLTASVLWENTALMAGNLVINEVVSNNVNVAPVENGAGADPVDHVQANGYDDCAAERGVPLHPEHRSPR